MAGVLLWERGLASGTGELYFFKECLLYFFNLSMKNTPYMFIYSLDWLMLFPFFISFLLFIMCLLLDNYFCHFLFGKKLFFLSPYLLGSQENFIYKERDTKWERTYFIMIRLGQERGLRIIGRFELACGRVEVQDSKISGLSTISDQTPQNQLRLRAIWITVLRSSYVHVRCTWQDTWH